MRTAHSRFLDKTPVKKGDPYDRVVTSVWNLDPETKTLTYGATIYRRAAPNDHWYKADHRSLAHQRFILNPVRVNLQFCGDVTKLSCISMDWYIADNLIYKFGTHNKNKSTIIQTVTLPNNFNEEYSLLTPYNEDVTLFPTTENKNDWLNSACILLGVVCFAGSLIVWALR